MSREDEVLPACRSDVQLHVFGGDVVVHDEVSKRVHSLNGTAHRVLQGCDGAATLGQLLDSMEEEYAVTDRDVLRQDVLSILGSLREEGVFEGEAYGAK